MCCGRIMCRISNRIRRAFVLGFTISLLIIYLVWLSFLFQKLLGDGKEKRTPLSLPINRVDF